MPYCVYESKWFCYCLKLRIGHRMLKNQTAVIYLFSMIFRVNFQKNRIKIRIC